MKRLLALMLAAALALSLAACGGGGGNTNGKNAIPDENVPTDDKNTIPDGNVPTDDEIKNELSSTIELLNTVADYLDEESSFILEHWGNVEFFGNELYVRSEWEENKDYNSFVREDIGALWNIRNKVQESMDNVLDTIKNLTPSDATQDFFDAVKSYYLSLQSYQHLVDEFPEGYSKLTYGQAVADARSAYGESQANLQFFE